MINTRASTTGTVVRLKMGWEGPSWDPYSYDRITVKRDGHEATYHCGLGEWLKIDGCEIEDIEENPEAVDKMLWDTIGMDFATLKQLQALIESKPLRCECGKPKIGFGAGYAGEIVEYCVRCETILREDCPKSLIEQPPNPKEA